MGLMTAARKMALTHAARRALASRMAGRRCISPRRKATRRLRGNCWSMAPTNVSKTRCVLGLHAAARRVGCGALFIGAALIRRRCDVSQIGATQLHVAASFGHLEVLRLLLECGAKKEAKDKVRAVRRLPAAERCGGAMRALCPVPLMSPTATCAGRFDTTSLRRAGRQHPRCAAAAGARRQQGGEPKRTCLLVVQERLACFRATRH